MPKRLRALHLRRPGSLGVSGPGGDLGYQRDAGPVPRRLGALHLRRPATLGVLASAPTAVASATPAIEVSRPSGVNWGDALIGATVTAGIFLLGAAGALLRHRRRELAHP